MQFFYPLLITLAAIAAIFGYLKVVHSKIEQLLQWLGAMPKNSKGNISATLLRVLTLNWYTVLMMVLLWVLLFGPAVGEDIIEDYLSNLFLYQFFSRMGSLLSLSITIFLMSMSIWALPFFMYGESRTEKIKNKPEAFYLGTKILALMATAPYGLVGSAFLLALLKCLIQSVKEQQVVTGFLFMLGKALENKNTHTLVYIGLNVAFLVLFFVLQLFITWVSGLKFLPAKVFKKTFFKNRYLNILTWVLIWHLLLSLLTAAILFLGHNQTICCWLVPFYLLLSSTIVFRLMYYTNETSLSSKQIEGIVASMLTDDNRRDSKLMYLLLVALLFLGILYYFLVPSLSGTNSLYVLLVVFGFIIIYLDFMRNWFRNSRKLIGKVVAFVAIVAFLVMPFISPKKQFNIPMVTIANPSPKILLDSALKARLDSINRNADSSSNIYIVCGMGGGSRAGYITARVLESLNKLDPGFFDKTLCYSTVSGSSPGVFHYLKERDSAINDPRFLAHIYQENYNASGVFGLLFGDATEALLGPLLSKPLCWFSDSAHDYYDRNVRIRREYEFALQQAMEHKYADNWKAKSFAFNVSTKNYRPDAFEEYFNKQPGKLPLLFINTFEVNSGRRAVLSPFEAKDTNVFTNAMLPLQDPKFDSNFMAKDIMFRDASNLSELFPFLSGASTIGDNKNAQFVDGGYFENYGLATALDIVEYVQRITKNDSVLARRLKIILIKNSKQEAVNDHRSVQLLAPVAGALSSPFTGHANHFLQLFKNRFGAKGFYTIVFDDRLYKVPLTRALTQKHINAMNEFIRDSFPLGKHSGIRDFLENKIQ